MRRGSGFCEVDLDVVTLAAWFDGAGYVGGIEGQEKGSLDTEPSFLRESEYSEEKIAHVAGCMRATEMPRNPKNLVEQILCDADLAHLASEDFLALTEPVRYETKHGAGRKLTDTELLTTNIDSMSGRCDFTDYAKSQFEKQHRRNLRTHEKQLNWLKALRGQKSSGAMP